MEIPCAGQILLVGEGDFSLAVALRNYLCTTPLVASSVLTEDTINLHRQAWQNITILKHEGVDVLFEVDATALDSDERFSGKLFSRIIFNFPHIGGKSNIKKNRTLLKNFFSSAVHVLEEDGEICVTLAQGQGGTPADQPMRTWGNTWQVVAMASYSKLVLTKVVPFDASQFPEYSSTGFRSQDKHFNTDGAVTHIFRRERFQQDSRHDVEIKTVKIGDETHFCHPHVRESLARYRTCLSIPHHPVNLALRRMKHEVTIKMGLHQEVTSSPLLPVQGKNDARLLSHYVVQGNTEMDKLLGICSSEPIKTDAAFRDTPQIYVLRQTQLETLSALGTPEGLALHVGDVYVPCSVTRESIPVGCEVIGFCNGVLLTQVTQTIIDVLRGILITDEIITSSSVDPNIYTEYLDARTLRTLRVNIQGEDRPSATCRGEAASEAYLTLGYIGSMLSNPAVIVFIIFVDKVAQVLCSIQNPRYLWLSDTQVYEQFSHLSTVGTVGGRCKDGCCCHGNASSMTPVHVTQEGTMRNHGTGDSPRYHQCGCGCHGAEARCGNNIHADDSVNSIPAAPSTPTLQPYSIHPPVWQHDLSFWENPEKPWHEQTFQDLIRDLGGDSIQQVDLLETYVDATTGRRSRCYRETFQSLESALSYHDSHCIQSHIRLRLAELLHVELR